MSSGDPALDERVDQLVVLTDRLTALITQQAQAFEARRPQDAAANMNETASMANAYRHEALRIRQQAAVLNKLSKAQHQRLTRATEAFDGALARHGRALHAVKTVTEGLVQAIAEEIASQRTANAAYGPRGAKTRPPTAASITLNQRA
ncbi:MAG TPA: flagellar basal body protein [Caulobacteraceae bacterium]|jgi:hypothetical protein|nr:flagellar basal body protein [Caulobacteraceae bacterium]